jgi:hypothetical protein
MARVVARNVLLLLLHTVRGDFKVEIIMQFEVFVGVLASDKNLLMVIVAETHLGTK